MNRLNRFLNLLEKICLIFSTSAIGVMITLNIIQVFFRYVLNVAFVWVFPATMLLFIWSTFLGAFVVYRRKKDIVVRFIADLFPVSAQEKLTLITNILIIFFLILILIQAPTLIRRQTSIMQVIPLPRYIQALPLFIGLTGILLEYFSQTVALLKVLLKSQNRGGSSRS
ncbi:MAG: TRAP transporter small permease subunit [Desulfobacteraceae bacterium]|jgi:C4-dicarboxylate transporter DctM subunit|nr:TRAP transporter small permease subunit [Desulfobacteraceae bacterium]